MKLIALFTEQDILKYNSVMKKNTKISSKYCKKNLMNVKERSNKCKSKTY